MKFSHKRRPLIFASLALAVLLLLGVAGNVFLRQSYQQELGSASLISSMEKDEQALFDAFLQDTFQHLVTVDSLTLRYSLHDATAFHISEDPCCFSDVSQEGFDAQLAMSRSILNTLKSFNYHKLSPRQQLTYDVMKKYFSENLLFENYYLYQEPLSANNGIQVNLPVLLAQYPFVCQEDIGHYLDLLETIDIYFGQILILEQKKAHQGLFMGEANLKQVVSFCRNFSREDSDHLLLSSFSNRIQHCDFLDENQKRSYLTANENLIYDKVCPSYLALGNRLEKLSGKCTKRPALAHKKQGKKYYSLLVSSATGTTDSISTIYKDIEHQRENDLASMTALFTKDTSLASKCSNYDFFKSDPAKMLEQLKNAMAADFPVPVASVDTILQVDSSISEFTAPAFYFVAPLDYYQENTIYYNPSKTHSNLDLFTTMAHESYPGHLYQTIMSYEYGLEPIRTLMNYPGFTEGWATYVEMLSYHYTGMDPDLADVLSRNYAVILSLYASCDIGIHYYGWTMDDTRSFLSEFGIENGSVVNDIYQAILSDPANYLKYYVGYLNFLSLKDTCLDHFQDSSTEFHKAILQIGPCSFDVLRKHLLKMPVT